jgi:crotonobetainyl-CoA:carnitine CoA-transferase CaiB-like acyl-CoA transferase
LEAAIREYSVNELAEKLQAVDIPWGPVYDVPGALEFAQELGYDIVSDFKVHGVKVRTLSTPIWMESLTSHVKRPPETGEDGMAILTGLLGFSEAEANELLTRQLTAKAEPVAEATK